MNNNELLDVIIIGAGQAGLSTSYLLKTNGINHIVLERSQIGHSWTERWDSFMLNSPNRFNLLPGESLSDFDPEAFMSGKAYVNRLKSYAAQHQLPIQLGSTVMSLDKTSDGLFSLEVSHQGKTQHLKAKQVVVATGGENQPIIPAISRSVPDHIVQIHSKEYRNPDQLPTGAVLLIGSATSGVQIAEDLLAGGRKVYMSTSAVPRVPRRYRGRDIMEWMVEIGFLDKPTSQAEPFELNMKAPLMSGVGQLGHTISLQSLQNKGATLLGYLHTIDGNEFHFENNLIDHLQFGDNISSQFKQGIDQYINATGKTAMPPETDDADVPTESGSNTAPITQLNCNDCHITSVIWTTGFGGDFSWIKLPVLDEKGKPVHRDGITNVQGLYFMGMPWQRNLRSSLILGTGDDARVIVGEMLRHQEETIAASA